LVTLGRLQQIDDYEECMNDEDLSDLIPEENIRDEICRG